MAFASVTDRYSDEQIDEFYSTGQWHRDTFFDMLEAQVAERGDRLFLTDDTGGELTFRQLRDKALCLAVGLRRKGISVGDRVSVQVPNWVEYVIISVALSRLGAVLVPIMPIYRSEDVGYILGNAGVRIAITAHKFKKFDYEDMYTQLRDSTGSLEGIVVVRPQGDLSSDSMSFESLFADVNPEEAVAELGAGVGPDEPFVIVYSSGTTSRPKGCIHTFNTLACGSRLLAKGFGYTSEDVQFGPSPISHTTGLVTSVILPLMHGAASHVMEAWEPIRGIEEIRERGCTVAVGATTFLQMVMDAFDPAIHDIDCMRLWVAAGAPIPGSFVTKAADLFSNLKVLSLYGRTENAITTTCTVMDDPEKSITSDGRALPMQSVKIVDDAGYELPRGEEGDIAYKGAMHMLAYLENPEETAKLFTPEGYSRSGDLGRMDADGYVRVTGRTKDIVIRGGMNISVRQVEDLLAAHPAVRGVAAVAMPDERLGEAVCLYLVPAQGCDAVTLEKIKAYLLEQGVAIQKVPERLEIVDALPTTATGKIQKHVLRARIAQQIESDRQRARVS
ncbi:AMP-binding protein [Prescottella agglutinans]|uniref:Cyclohexanecarboxylate-CoA ligase n=1 Tax=Prescottella agglutinans TaxID=1644129 RepID=A0ABT6ML04_9NOCA|nr:AMP-binding protein [Prescottella agglutinans]MDH6284985.1 cyclohexanecarboxylate-CoA ligase [Prescottella agglutinans]